MQERGKFITVEGIEGVGKSSNIEVIVSHIERAGFDVVTTREPGGTPMAESIRSLVLDDDHEPVPMIAELLLVFAARALNVNNLIEPALQGGTWVVCDRFTDSSRAYQGGGRGLDRQAIDQLAEWVHPATNPDLTILLDAPIDIARERTDHRGAPDRIEQEKAEFFARVRKAYLALAQNEPERFTVVDTTLARNRVKREVCAVLDRLLDRESL